MVKIERGINTKVYRYQQPPSVDKLRHKEYLSVYTDLIKFEDKETQMKNGTVFQCCPRLNRSKNCGFRMISLDKHVLINKKINFCISVKLP